MNSVRQVDGLVLPVPQADIDTDQIIPKQFLKRIERTGYGTFLFHERRGESGFPLDETRFRGASILAAGPNFGCGSSREHAAWALWDFGIRAVVSSSLADIFRTNCYQVGIVPVEVTSEEAAVILEQAAGGELRLSIDVDSERYTSNTGMDAHFTLDPFRRRCLLEGLDDIDLTISHSHAIERYEKDRAW